MNTKRLKSALAAMMMLFCLQASAQMEFIEKYEDNKNATYVYVGKAMLQMVGAKQFSMPGRDMSAIADKINGIQIITSEDATTAAKIKADVAEEVKKHGYEVLMKANEEDTKMTIYFLQGKKESYVLMSVAEGESANLIAFTGTFTMEDIANLTKEEDQQ